MRTSLDTIPLTEYDINRSSFSFVVLTLPLSVNVSHLTQVDMSGWDRL